MSVLSTVISNTKYHTKIDAEKIIIPGVSIIDILKGRELYMPLVLSSIEIESKKKSNFRITDEISVLLDETFSKVDYIPGLKTTLYPHQQTIVKAMLDLEHTRMFTMNNSTGGQTYNIAYNSAVLSEPVGSGKTIDILAVICMNKIPRVLPDIMELRYTKFPISTGYVRRKFKKFLKASIIFVGSSVMKQWENAIKIFTDLKCFSVNSIKELKKLLEMISNNTINNYDIVLVKNGRITRSIQLPDGIFLEEKNKVSQAYIYNIIANLRKYCWARVVVDDFDTIRLPHNAGIVNGIFTWYISSTRKKMEKRRINNDTYEKASELLKNFDYGCANIMYNNFLFYYLNARNNLDYLKSITQIPNPKYHVAVFKNPNNKYISLLGSMGDEEINRITEMLNGDAIEAAAEAAGIKTSSVSSIFEKILGSKFNQYRYAGDLLSFIEHLREEEHNRLSMSDNPDPDDRYGKKDLLSFREVEYKYPGVNKIIDTTDEEYTVIKKQSGSAIQRVKDNIKHGRCPICRIDLEDTEETIIVKCCGAVFCGDCGIKGQNLNDRYNKLSHGRCSNCRTDIGIKDLIYIGDDIKLNKIENEEFEEDDIKAIDISIEDNPRLNKIRTKYTAMIDIILGEKIPEAIRVDMHLPNMMKGSAYLEEPDVRKVLIFANYDETLKNVVKELEEEKIHYWRLSGGINDINEVSLAFTQCKNTCALVINSTKHCSGLNLQSATDLIFAHNIIDSAVESQVAGRGHRLGRKSPLNIWFMQYDNEYESLVDTHGVRKLTEEELLEEKERAEGKAEAIINTIEDNTDAFYLDKRKPTIDHHRNERNAPNKKKAVTRGRDDDDEFTPEEKIENNEDVTDEDY